MFMDKVKWGIIGCGAVCEKKSGPAFYKTAHSELTAVMRRDGARVADFARRHGVERFYTSVEELLADRDVNAIYVATPPSSHCEMAIRALESGRPVYVEKPMAMNAAECAAMNAAAERTGQKLFVAYYRRALPYFLKVKEILTSGSVGEPLTVAVRLVKPPRENDLDPATHSWHLDRAVGGEGYFYDLAPHTLDILDFLLGEITAAAGVAENLGGLYEVADTVSARLEWASGVRGEGFWHFVAKPENSEDSIIIEGTGGSVAFSTFAFTPIRVTTSTGEAVYDISPPEHIQQSLITTIVAELRGVGTCPSTGISAARTSRVMDEIMVKSLTI
jgi:predicted dehydrogenase